MNLFEALPKEEVHILRRYIDEYGDYDDYGPAIDESQMDYFLRFWSEAKKPFFHMFNNQFIIKKKVFFTKSIDEIAQEISLHLVNNEDDIIFNFKHTYLDKIRVIFDNFNDYYEMERFVTDSFMLANNIYIGDGITIPKDYTVNGRPLTIKDGCKAIKMLGKIVKALGIEEGYEHFRQAHSQILNQKKISGNLCLSIHPLDFLTMSDNDCGWDSCMKWVNEAGDYRLGTIEMMNSNCVVVAYLEAGTPFYPFGEYLDNKEITWSNKKWRQLYIVTPDVILGNRQYPYPNDELQGAAINWLKSLCTSVPGYGPYSNETSNIANNEFNSVSGRKDQVYFNFYCDYMYNDIYDYRLAYVNPNISNRYDLNFSGLAVCTGCGEVIAYGEAESYCVRCKECDGLWKCDCCGQWCRGESYEVNGEYCCEWCYVNEFTECEACGQRVREVKKLYIQLKDSIDSSDIYFNNKYCICLCENCYNDPHLEDIYGPVYFKRRTWSDYRVVYLENIKDIGLERGMLSFRSIEFLKRLRDAKSKEERIKIYEEYLI